jgi:hypothetical protein
MKKITKKITLENEPKNSKGLEKHLIELSTNSS